MSAERSELAQNARQSGGAIAPSHSVDLTPAQAAALIQEELTQANRALGASRARDAFDSYVRALGLAFQLGPAPTEQVLVAVLQAAEKLALGQDVDGLSTLGPALVELVSQVRAAGALPSTTVMEAWAAVADGLGALIGQLGLALALPADRRSGMMNNARAHAALLDDATGELFHLVDWLDSLFPTP